MRRFVRYFRKILESLYATPSRGSFCGMHIGWTKKRLPILVGKRVLKDKVIYFQSCSPGESSLMVNTSLDQRKA